MESKKMLQQFRLIAVLEGISYLVLLGIAMPLKYFAGKPEMVKITGMTHGVLFILFGAYLVACTLTYGWKAKFSIWAFLYSIIPFGTFVLEKKLKAL
jgi:integral membrane protein